MNLPGYIDLGPHRIEVRTDEATARLLRDEQLRGKAHTSRALILLDPDGPESAVAESLLHELLHHCYDAASLAEGDDQERIVASLATWLLEALRRNPDLAAALVRGGAGCRAPTAEWVLRGDQ